MTMRQHLRLTLSLLAARALVTWRRWRAPRGFDPQAGDMQQVYSQTSWGKDALDDPLLIDGMTDFSGGQQSFLRATLIPSNAYQKGLNILVRDNYEARTRPGADMLMGDTPMGLDVVLPANYTGNSFSLNLTASTQYSFIVGANEIGFLSSLLNSDVGLTYTGHIGQVITFTTAAVGPAIVVTNGTGAPNLPVTAVLLETTAASCLGLYYFDTPNYQQLLAAFDGEIFAYAGGAWAQTAYTPSPTRLAMAQGVDKLLISDANNPIVLYDGLTFTPQITAPGPGSGPNDPPLGATILCFHQGCMFAAGIPPADNSNQYPGTPIFSDTIMVSNSLAIGSGQWNNVTRSFRIGNGDGQAVIALASIQDQTLCAFKSNSIWLANTSDTSNVFNFKADQATAALSQGIGIVGRDAWCAYGNDLLFMAQDGIRSVQRMQAAAGQWQLSAPLSLPIQDVIASINWAYAFQIVAKKYQEFAFFFVPTGISAVNNTVIVYNGRLNTFVGTFTNWNGQAVEITRFGGVNRLVFGGIQFDVNMWKDYADPKTDSTYTDNGMGYPSALSTRSFQHNDFVLDKQPHNAILRFTAGNATVNVSWYGDLADQKDWQVAPAPSGDILGVDVLPFLLASTSPTKFQESIREAPPFNEGYLALSSTAGWWWLRQCWITAWANPLKETP